MTNAKALQDAFNSSPVMIMLRGKIYLVGSMPEGSRNGDIQEVDCMLDLSNFKENFLQKTETATMLSLTEDGKSFFREYKNTKIAVPTCV